MANDPKDAVTDVSALLDTADLRARRGRLLVVLGAALFGLSTVFPVVASLVEQERFPVWVGLLDVALAFALVLLTAVIASRWRRVAMDSSFRERSVRLPRVSAREGAFSTPSLHATR
jgi:hypothetical protein